MARAPTKPRTRRTPDPGYVSATVLPGESVAARFSHNPTVAAMVARGLQQTLAYCVATNAVNVSQCRLRVFRKGKAGGKGLWRGRAVGRKHMAYLRGDLGVLPGRKAMEHADDAGDIEEVMEGPLVDILRRPDPFQTGNAFILLTQWFKEATGRAWTMKGERAGGSPVSLYSLYPQWCRVQPHPSKFISGVWYGRNTAEQKFYDIADVIYHKHMPSPTNPFEAVSWPQTLQLETDYERAAVEAGVNRWNNGGHPGLIIGVDGTAPPQDKRKQIEADMANTIQGVAKAGRTLFIWGKTTVSSGVSAKDQAFAEGMEYIRKQIFRAADIPESMMEMSDASLANAYTAHPQYARNCIHPRLCRLEDEFNEGLVPEFVDGGEYFIAFDNPVAEDEDAKVDRAVKLATAGIIRREVLAEELGYKVEDVGTDPNAVPVEGEEGEEGEATDVPEGDGAQVQAAAEGSLQQEALNGAQVTALAELASQVAQGKLPERSARAIARAAFPLVSDELLTEIFGGLEAFEPEPDPAPGGPPGLPGSDNADPSGGAGGDDEDDAGGGGRKALSELTPAGTLPADEPVRPGEDAGVASATGRDGGDATPAAPDAAAWEGCGCGHPTTGTKDYGMDNLPPAVARALTALEKQLKAWGESAIASASITQAGATFTAEAMAALNRIMATALPDIIQAAGESAANDVGGTGWNLQANPQAVAYAQTRGLELAKTVNETLRGQLQTVIADGLEKGKTLNEIQADIVSQAPEIAASRAEVIARTETSAAANEGSRLAWADNGVERHAWLIAGGPCPICDQLNGKTVGINEPFVAAGGSVGGLTTPRAIMAPPAHPNCRCTSIPVIDTGGEG